MAQHGTPETVKRRELVGKLNPLCLKAFSAASQAAKTRGNPYVELVHFVAELDRAERSDMQILLRAAEVDASRLEADLTRALDALPRGAGSIEYSDHIFRFIHEGWSYGQLEHGDETVRSAYLLLAALENGVLEALLFKMSLEFGRLDAPSLTGQLDDLLVPSFETGPSIPAERAAPKAPGGKSALAQFTTDLTHRAREGHIDPVIGRDPEIRQIIDILMRRRQNNPILTGEAGVGKTAVVEGFAQRIACGDVPPPLRDVELRLLDIGLMKAGASIKGEFEKRLKSVIEEVQSSDVPVILFIDEAHTLIGAGGAAGTGDAANLLKPPLARGELRTVAATTWSEYKQYIEPDPALTRRFQNVRIEEPTEDAAIRMSRGISGVLETHHKVEVLDEAIEASVRLSHRYVPSRQLPDKAISLLDTACARVAVSQHATPAAVEDIERRISALKIERDIAKREAAIGLDRDARIAETEAALTAAGTEFTEARVRWDSEKELVKRILDLRARLRRGGAPLDGDEAPAEAAQAPAPEREGPKPSEALPDTPEVTPHENLRPLTGAEREETRAELLVEMARLAETQGEAPLILPSVDRNAVAAVVQDWTGIPTGRMLASQKERALNLAKLLGERIVGQDHALEMIANRNMTAAAGIGAPEKPIGVFLLCGPSGTGKTETALALADILYGGEQNLISINMSEFQEAHTVSTLKGAPPGYVGYGKGGVLTEAVRRRPYSVILLDEVEKAHPDIHEIFFQVFDKGMMDDSEGRRIDFKNTLLLLTSNVGTDEIMALTDEGRRKVEPTELQERLRPALLRIFPAALLGRLVTIPYYPLSDWMIETIARQKLNSIAQRLTAAHGAEIVVEEGALDVVKARCTELEFGRPHDRRHPDQHSPARARATDPRPQPRGATPGSRHCWRRRQRLRLQDRLNAPPLRLRRIC